jgi:hypothetical protein
MSFVSMFIEGKTVRNIRSVTTSIARVFLTTCIACGVTACAALNPKLNDLRFVSVEVIVVQEHPEIEWVTFQPSEIPRLELVEVSFSSSEDLVKLAKRAEYNVGGDARLCESDKKRPTRINAAYVYWGNVVVDQYMNNDVYAKLSRQRTSGGSFIYRVYFSIKLPETKEGLYQSPAYDLLNVPADICFHVRGGNMLGMSFVSNEVVISKESIEAAFRRVGMKGS